MTKQDWRDLGITVLVFSHLVVITLAPSIKSVPLWRWYMVWFGGYSCAVLMRKAHEFWRVRRYRRYLKWSAKQPAVVRGPYR